MNQYPASSYDYQVESQDRYAAKTFAWMFVGLLTTFVTAVFTLYSGTIYYTASGFMPFILALAEVGVVIYLSARLQKLSIGSARALFFVYAVLNGLTMSSLLVIYSLGSLIYVFGMTSLYFGVMALYGWFTHSDLSGLRPVLVGGLIVLLVISVLSMLLGFSGSSRLMCIAGVALFIGFTAYDTQKIRAYYNYFYSDPEMLEKASVISALQLYLDYINLFLYLLRLFGKRRN